jgi:hypothetical protein
VGVGPDIEEVSGRGWQRGPTVEDDVASPEPGTGPEESCLPEEGKRRRVGGR